MASEVLIAADTPGTWSSSAPRSDYKWHASSSVSGALPSQAISSALPPFFPPGVWNNPSPHPSDCPAPPGIWGTIRLDEKAIASISGVCELSKPEFGAVDRTVWARIRSGPRLYCPYILPLHANLGLGQPETGRPRLNVESQLNRVTLTSDVSSSRDINANQWIVLVPTEVAPEVLLSYAITQKAGHGSCEPSNARDYCMEKYDENLSPQALVD